MIGRNGLHYAFIGLLFVFAALVRFHGLVFQSFWEDELFSAAISSPANSLGNVIDATMRDVHPPLFQILLWVWFKILGYSEFSGRLFSAACGAMAVPAIYALGRQMGGIKVGTWTALFCAINFYHLFYSQEMRSYALIFLLSILSFLFLVRFIEGRRYRDLLLYLLFTVSLLYSHFFSLYVILAQGIGFLVFVTRDRRLLGAGVGVAVLLSAALVPLLPLLTRNSDIQVFFFSKPPGDFFLYYLRDYFHSVPAAFAAAAMVLVAILGVRDTRNRVYVSLLLIWVASVWVIPYVHSLVKAPIITNRNTIVALPAILLLMGYGIVCLEDVVRKALVVAVFVILSVFGTFFDPPYYQTVIKPQVREAAVFLLQRNPNADAVFAPNEVMNNFNVYFTFLGVPLRARDMNLLLDDQARDTVPRRFWLIDGRAGPVLAKPLLQDPRFKVLQRQDFQGSGFVEMERID